MANMHPGSKGLERDLGELKLRYHALCVVLALILFVGGFWLGLFIFAAALSAFGLDLDQPIRNPAARVAFVIGALISGAGLAYVFAKRTTSVLAVLFALTGDACWSSIPATIKNFDFPANWLKKSGTQKVAMNRFLSLSASPRGPA